METPLRIPLTRRTWSAALLAFGLLGLIESFRDIAGRRELGQVLPVWVGLLGNMPWWLLWALLLPVVAGLVIRFPLTVPFRFRNLGVHLAAGVALSFAHGVANGALYWAVMIPYRPEPVPLATVMFGIANRFLFMNLLTYGAVVGAAHALAFAARLREREVVAARLEQAVTAARLDALRMELNPHFLFNTLNAISGLVLNGERDTAVRMLARLGDLLRRTLDRGAAHLVPLSRELELAQLHLEIEQVRFRDRLVVGFEPDPTTLDLPVPTLILQPLIENAIRHGVAPIPGPGAVTVRSRREGPLLVLEVEDTGLGFGSQGPSRSNGVGLTNVRARLAELYGARASLTFHQSSEGFQARIALDPGAPVAVDAELAP